ncbi:hypothetical protein Tco_1034488, partial [Tanacetum coccineum]
HNMRMLVKDTRSQDGKDDKDNDKGSKSRSQSMKEQAYNKEQRERPRPHELNDKSNLIDLMKEYWYQEPRYSHVGFKDSTVTYTEVSSPFVDLSDIGSPGVDGPPVMPEDPYAYVVAAFQAPSSPDYVPGHEEPKQAPPQPDFILELVYLEFMPPKDEVLPAEEQPLPAAASPTADLEEGNDEDPEEDPADYPPDGGDDGDDDEDDDDVDIKEDEEEHLAPADSTAVAFPAVDHASYAEETEPFETDESATTPPPHPAYRVTARISILDEPPTPFWSDTEVARLLAIHTPPPSPLSPWSSPLPQIPSPPLLVSPLLPLAPPPLPLSPTYPLGNRAAMIRVRADASFTSHSPPPHIILSHTRADTPPSGTPPLLPIPLPTSSPPLHLPSANHGADRLEVCLPPRKRLCIALGPRYEVGESSSAAATRPTRDAGRHARAPSTDDTELGRRMTKCATRVRKDTYEIYVRLDDEQTERQLMADRLNMMYRDRREHARIALLMETDRRRQVAITELLAADRKRQAQFIEALKLLKGLQTQMTEFQRQQGPIKGPAQPDAPEEASSSS